MNVRGPSQCLHKRNISADDIDKAIQKVYWAFVNYFYTGGVSRSKNWRNWSGY